MSLNKEFEQLINAMNKVSTARPDENIFESIMKKLLDAQLKIYTYNVKKHYMIDYTKNELQKELDESFKDIVDVMFIYFCQTDSSRHSGIEDLINSLLKKYEYKSRFV